MTSRSRRAKLMHLARTVGRRGIEQRICDTLAEDVDDREPWPKPPERCDASARLGDSATSVLCAGAPGHESAHFWGRWTWRDGVERAERLR